MGNGSVSLEIQDLLYNLHFTCTCGFLCPLPVPLTGDNSSSGVARVTLVTDPVWPWRPYLLSIIYITRIIALNCEKREPFNVR